MINDLVDCSKELENDKINKFIEIVRNYETPAFTPSPSPFPV